MYVARIISEIDNGKDFWKYQKIGVFRKSGSEEDKVGEYKRNYPSFIETFHYFHLNGKDLAVFSPEYTATRIMELPSCRDIGGEDPNGQGFCPTGYYIPRYQQYLMKFKRRDGTEEEGKYRIWDPNEEAVNASGMEKIGGVVYAPFGFVSGCVWGDDSSWKIQHLDLSQADQGILKRDDRFGYIELPANLKLKDAIGMDGFEDGRDTIRIATESYYRLGTGKRSE